LTLNQSGIIISNSGFLEVPKSFQESPAPLYRENVDQKERFGDRK
jgi:hypothetical protein